MEDEKREVKNAGKSVEQIHKEPLRHPLPARPIVTDLRPLAPAPARTHKHSASNGREITIQGAQLLGKSILTSSLTTKPSSSASLKSRMVNGTAAESTESEQQPVPFFLEEKDTRDHSQREHSATRVGYIPLGNSKVPSEQVPLIDRMSMGTHGSSTTASLRSPEDTVANRGLWKRLTPSEAAKDHGQEPVKLPLKSPMNLVTGNAKLPPTGPKHRENAKNFGGPNGTRNYPNISYKAPGHLPPTEPRSMRQTASNALAPQPDPQRTTTSPVTPSTSDRNQVLQATEPPNLDVGEPAKPKPAELPKQDKNFQSLASFTYKQAIISVALKGLGNEGLLIKGFPICPQRCNAGSPNPDESSKSPKLGCSHIESVELDCLSSTLPKEVHVPQFEVLKLEADTSTPLTKVPPGRALYVQATGELGKGSIRWHIILDANAEKLSKFLAKEGKEIESGSFVPEAHEMLEAAKSSIPIYVCEQQVGDVICLPPRALYQVTTVQIPTDLRVWTAYPLRAIISKEVTRDTFASHRTCNSAALPIRTMLYYHLRALYKDISDPTNESPAFKTKQDEKAYLHNLADAMKLFDRILAEEYTQGSREDEPRLEDPGSCDFCGTEIFHAALVCSSKFGLWARSLIPDKCCEVRLCPSCCSEGRSCLCGNLRLCTVFDYEELVDMRNKIWAWCLSREETLDVPDEIAQVLTTSAIYEDLRRPHLVLGAISILNIRNSVWAEEKYSGDGLRLVVVCKGGALSCEEHEVSQLQAVTCNECYETICFKHLLAAGIHSWEAAFRREHDRSWHEVHTTWSAQWIQWSKDNPPDPDDLLITLATSLPMCKPLKHESIRLGFYDTADPSLNCARYEDDPILRLLDDKPLGIEAITPGLVTPTIKNLKGFKRKSETPGPGELSDTRTAKRKKKATERDAPFNPKPGGRKGKTSKKKSRLSIATSVEVDTDDDSASTPLRLDQHDLSAATPTDERESSPPELVQLGLPISLDTRLRAQSAILLSGPPSTCRSSFDYSPEQSSSVATPVEYYAAEGKDEMTLLRQQMEALMRKNENLSKENEDLKQRVQQAQEDREARLQARDQEIARLAAKVMALENPPPQTDAMSVSPTKSGRGSRHESEDSDSDSDSERERESNVRNNPLRLVPY